ncbi:MurR/RpiR family transcriptional regulator, partial [Streptomyces sp. NPDC059517]|uniref:MurR/RpiR family transcriptional regulator n=1 Tax=Streptomyces sp. NPDC059517 TaxID=3346855 RepID=UPI0036B7294D
MHQLFEGRRLTPTQRRIAHCLVRRTAAAPFLSSVELAQLAGVSQPSVTRFAVALGFDGYPALRRHLRDVVPVGGGGGPPARPPPPPPRRGRGGPPPPPAAPRGRPRAR